MEQSLCKCPKRNDTPEYVPFWFHIDPDSGHWVHSPCEQFHPYTDRRIRRAILTNVPWWVKNCFLCSLDFIQPSLVDLYDDQNERTEFFCYNCRLAMNYGLYPSYSC